jgi:hypothetical protein
MLGGAPALGDGAGAFEGVLLWVCAQECRKTVKTWRATD